MDDDSADKPLVGKEVWLETKEGDDFWVLAKVENQWGGKVYLNREVVSRGGIRSKLEMSEADFAKLTVATKADSDPTIEDLTALFFCADASMLHVLRIRYDKDEIYTNVGQVLLAINPYKGVPCCTQQSLRNLAKMPVDAMSPHIVKLTAIAFAGLVENGEPQSILISGESGAGKTETAKLCMHCLAALSGGGARGQEVSNALLKSNDILEGLGNARTLLNNNSSRFGKWMGPPSPDPTRVRLCRVAAS
jgi:myosin heavy subunit